MFTHSSRAAFIFALVSANALAHDTWLHAIEPASNSPMFELVTGAHYPKAEFRPGADMLKQSLCVNGGHSFELIPNELGGQFLRLMVGTTHHATAKNSALICGVELNPSAIELSSTQVEEYLAEIRAPAHIRTAWQQQKGRGQAWVENYRKFAKIELASSSIATDQLELPRALNAAFELIRQSPLQGIKLGEEITWQLLYDGQPLANQPIELRGDNVPLGIWGQTDEAGMAKFKAIAPGGWLLRTTVIHLPQADSGRWESFFATYHFTLTL